MIKRSKLFISVILVSVFVAAVVLSSAAQDKAGNNLVIKSTKELFENVQLFTDSLSLISAEYVEDIKTKDLIYGAIKGMLDKLDGYSQFLDPEGFKEITEETKGEFCGVGMEVGIRDGIVTVISPIEDSPAFKAGLMSGDMIVKINGKSTRDMTLDDAVKSLRGESGTKVKIVVIREGMDRMLDFELTRTVIKLKSIKTSRIIDGDIGYVKLVEFQQGTSRDLEKTIKELVSKGAKNLILDLRNNPGGLLDAAIAVSELFLEPEQMVVYTEGRDHKDRTEYRSKRKSEFTGMKLVVLVNKGSASAAEIVAAAIRDNKRGMLLGVTTFGKGSVQAVVPLKDGSAVRLTTAYYYSPSGKNINKKGVEPDISIEYHEYKSEEESKAEKKKKIVFDDLEEEIIENEPAPSDKDKQKSPEATKDIKKDKEKKEEFDSQLSAAVNIIKGLQVFESYTTPRTCAEENPKK